WVSPMGKGMVQVAEPRRQNRARGGANAYSCATMTASIPPKPLPRNLRPPAGRRPLQAIGGKTGLAVFLMLASSVLVLGWIAWEKYGHAIQKVFATNRSSHYASREEFFASRIEEVANASP